MKKMLFAFVFTLCLTTTFAQTIYSDTPFQIPKGVVVLNEASSKNIKVKVG